MLVNKKSFAAAIVAFMMMCPAVVFSQVDDDSGIVVFYNPVFWKDELKLSRTQCSQIRQIDISFYHSIAEAVKGARQGKLEESSYTELLIDRSRSIWDTFTDRQKRRWKRLEVFDQPYFDSAKTKTPES